MACCSLNLNPGRSLSTSISSKLSAASFSYRTSKAIAAMRAWSSVSCTGGGTSSSSGRFELETSSSSPSEGDARARVARRAGRDRRTAEEGARDDAHRVGTSARARTACIVRRPRGRSFDDKSAWTE
jgi:hypothetical protein|eukprot:30921-Pelagococcus_subviridis.AAC.3